MNTEYQATLVEKTFPHKPQCPNHANAIYDCGFYNITEQQCLDRKCCWDPTSPKVSQLLCYPAPRAVSPMLELAATARVPLCETIPAVSLHALHGHGRRTL